MLLKMLFVLLSPLFRLVRRFEDVVNRVVVDENRLDEAAKKAWSNKGKVVPIKGTPFQIRVFETAIYDEDYMFEFGDPGNTNAYDLGFANSPEGIVEHIVWLFSYEEAKDEQDYLAG